MRNDRSCITSICGLLVTAACAGPSVDPGEFAASLSPVRQLDEAARVLVEQATATAIGAWRSGDHIAAARAAETALDLDPRAARALAVQAAARHRRGRAEYPATLSLVRHAEGEMRQASALAPDDPLVALEHARLLAAEGHLSAAVDRAERLLFRTESGGRIDPDVGPRHPELLRFAALLRYDLGDERAALASLRKVQRLQPEDAEVAYRIARARFRLARTAAQEQDRARGRQLWQQTIADFGAYRSLRPADPDGPLGEAQARAAVHSGEESTLELDSDSILALFDLADELAQTTPGAESAAAGRYGRGVFLEQLGRPAEARAAFEVAVQRDPGHAASWLNLAANQAAADLPEAARRSCARALDLKLSADERAGVEGFLAETHDSSTR